MRPGAHPPVGCLRKRRDFVAAASGRRFHTERMTVQGRRRDDGPEGPLRVGLTVTKRVGHATERNRIKRRLRRAVAEAATDHWSLPADVVVLARRDAISADFTHLVEDLEKALRAVTRPKPARKDPPRPSSDERRGPPHA